MMFVIVLVLFLWMVRTVIIAAILGVIVASFTRPIYLWLYRQVPSQIVAATLTLLLLIVPVARADAPTATTRSPTSRRTSTRTRTRSRRRSTRRCTSFRSCKRRTRRPPFATTSSWRRTTARTSSARCARRVASLAIAATIFVFTVYYVLCRRRQDPRVHPEPNSAALRRAVDGAGVERSRCAVRRDLLDVPHADDQDR